MVNTLRDQRSSSKTGKRNVTNVTRSATTMTSQSLVDAALIAKTARISMERNFNTSLGNNGVVSHSSSDDNSITKRRDERAHRFDYDSEEHEEFEQHPNRRARRCRGRPRSTAV
jgi:hypothetical protein